MLVMPVADRVAKMFPNKVYRVPHDKFKDANEFPVRTGLHAEFRRVLGGTLLSTRPRIYLNSC